MAPARGPQRGSRVGVEARGPQRGSRAGVEDEEDEVLITTALATYDEKVNETADLALKAPGQVGEHTWTILFPRHEGVVHGVVHEESCLVVSFTTRPHTTSMAVWDVPSPVVINRSFTVKVGVKCAATCQLAGRLIEVCDEAGARIGESRLGETPWPGTAVLYVAEVELAAPATEGMASWSARFAGNTNAALSSKAPQTSPSTKECEAAGRGGGAPRPSEEDPGLPHAAASATFSFRTARPPEHRVTVKVTEKDTETPLENVGVRLGMYQALTDAQGLASLQVPGGVYNLDAWKAGYETLPRTVEVGKDLMVQVEALCVPENDPDDTQVWM